MGRERKRTGAIGAITPSPLRGNLRSLRPAIPIFGGDAARYSPEELLVASLSCCHMLWYLHLCAANRLVILGYDDAPSGVMTEDDEGSGEFVRVLLRPTVKIAAGNDRSRALALHSDAHRYCFIARSVRFPVEIAPEITEVPGQ
jgi:organic hydroperoxide reductase OsmC/OhrA